MPVTVESGVSGPFYPNGVTTVFAFDFKADSATEVIVVDENGTALSPALYSVTLSLGEGGSVAFSVAPILADYDALFIVSAPAMTQESDFGNAGPSFNPVAITRAFDRAAIRDLFLQSQLDRAIKVPFGDEGIALPADRAGKFLSFDAGGVPIASSGTGADSGLRTDLAAVSGSSLVNYRRTVSATARPLDEVLGETVSVKDYGAKGDGTTDDTAAFNAAFVALRGGMSDPTGRMFAGRLMVPDGLYRVNGPLQAAPVGGVTGLTIEGTAAGSSAFLFTHPTSTFQAQSSRDVTIRKMGFQGSAVDDNQVAITVAAGGNPLRSWVVEECDFSAFYRAFSVTGSVLCSEFYLKANRFVQCYTLLYNDNVQAVDWNLLNNDWENDAIVTSKNKNLAAAIHLKKGSMLNWIGGSTVFRGMLVYYDLTAADVFARTSHGINIAHLRMELEDDGAGGHAPIIDRVATGYTNGSNFPTTSLSHCTILNKGAIPGTVVYANVWGNSSLDMYKVTGEGGKIVGILDGVTSSAEANVDLLHCSPEIVYEEDITNRSLSHHQHNVTIVPANRANSKGMLLDQRLAKLTVPASTYMKRWTVRGETGSIPATGTNTPIQALPNHFVFTKLWVHRFAAATQNFTVALRDQADTTTYATLTINAGELYKEVMIGLEMGFQIPAGTALMLKYTGTTEDIKGLVGFDYL